MPVWEMHDFINDLVDAESFCCASKLEMLKTENISYTFLWMQVDCNNLPSNSALKRFYHQGGGGVKPRKVKYY